MNEFGLIERYFNRGVNDASVACGIGDDCAVLSMPGQAQLAISIDTLVENVHFPANADPEKIAERALCVTISDLAAMGAQPMWYTLALALPQADEKWLAAFSEGLHRKAAEFGCHLVGGDTTKGPLTITIQVHGTLEEGQMLTRGGASADELVCVTGPLGDGAAALAVINNELDVGSAAFRYLMDRYYRPTPQIKAGLELVGVATSAIDVSDGLLADLGHICKASGIGADIDIDRLPVSDAVLTNAGAEEYTRWALSGGDDYQLCFTLPRDKESHLHTIASRLGSELFVIGETTRGDGVTCVKEGQPVSMKSSGYSHF